MGRTAEQKRAIEEATEWVKAQMAGTNDDITYQDLVDKFGVSIRAAHEIATVTGFHRAGQHMLSDVNPDTREAKCSICGPTVIWKRSREYGVSWTCRTKGTERNRQHSSGGKRAHGLNKAEAIRYREGKVCAICGSTQDLVVDHCHDSGKIRDVLCRWHNTALGLFKDNSEHLRKAADYLDLHVAS